MAALEAKLIISAEDRTKKAFAAIMARFEKVLEMAKGLDRAQGSAQRAMAGSETAIARAGRVMEASATRVERAGRAMETTARQMERAASAMRRVPARFPSGSDLSPARPHGAVRHSRGAHEAIRTAELIASERGIKHVIARGGAGIPVVGGTAAVAGVLAYEGAKFVGERRGERVHEQVREDIAGMAPEEREAAEKQAAILSARYPSVDQTSIMHSLRNARATTGSYEQAAGLADDIIKMRIVAQAAKPDRDIEHETDQLMKAMEQHGDTMNPAAFRAAMRRINKVLAVEGDTLSPADIFMTAQYSRQALPATSQRFMYGVAPAVAQEMRGNSFGVGLAGFNRAIVNGRMDGHALRTALGLGLIDKSDVVLDKKGEPVRVKSTLEGGHGFADAKLAATDPDQYIYSRIAKALDEHGIRDPAQRDQVIGDLFSKSMAANLVTKFIDQRDRIEKNSANFARAPDDPAERILAGDPIAAWKGVENSFSNLAAAIPVSGSAVTGALNAVANALNDQAARMQGVKTDHARIADNLAAYNIASAQDLGKMSPADLAPLKAAATADLQQKLLAAKLELQGVRGEEATQANMSWFDYLRSGRDKVADAMLPFRDKNLSKEITDLNAVIARLGHLGETLPVLPAPGNSEHDRIVRAATGGAALGGPFGGGPAAVEVSGTLQGQIQGKLDGEIRVVPGSELVSAVAKINTAVAKVDAMARVSRQSGSAPTGTSMPEALATGRQGIDHH